MSPAAHGTCCPLLKLQSIPLAGFALGLALLIVTGQLLAIVLGLASIDAIGAFWTWRCLNG